MDEQHQKHDNSGILFINDKKTKDGQPSMRGRATINGKDYYVSAWTKLTKENKKYLSLAFEPANNLATAVKATSVAQQTQPNGIEDDLPY